VASTCAAKRKAERAQSKADHEAQREQERWEREKEEKEEQKMLREVKVWCWHCGGLGHTKADCGKLFKLKLQRQHAESAKDDDACSDSTVATATDKVAPRQKCWPLAPRPSGCSYCGEEGHTARVCKERLAAKERSSAFSSQSIEKRPVAAVHKKFEPKACDFPELSAGTKEPVRRRAQRTGLEAPAPDAADCELHGMD